MLKTSIDQSCLKAGILIFSIGLSGCYSNYSLTPHQPTEAALVANSIANGLTTELDIGYEKAFLNLKQAYGRCLAFTGEKDFVFADNKYEPNLEMGTLLGRSDDGVYLYKTTVESIGENKTRFTLYLPPDYKFAKTRFKQDIKRAFGKDKECNV